MSLAYEVAGEGERDILVTFGWVGSFESAWRTTRHTRAGWSGCARSAG